MVVQVMVFVFEHCPLGVSATLETSGLQYPRLEIDRQVDTGLETIQHAINFLNVVGHFLFTIGA